MALLSFIHSLNINFETTFFETITFEFAEINFKITEKQVTAGIQISDRAQMEIQNIVDEILATSVKPRKIEEIEGIRKVCQTDKNA
jgi:hypothetical protein